MTRQDLNRQIVSFLADSVEAHPDQRFGQLLRNLRIVEELRDEKGTPNAWKNLFNEEPEHTLKRMFEPFAKTEEEI